MNLLALPRSPRALVPRAGGEPAAGSQASQRLPSAAILLSNSTTKRHRNLTAIFLPVSTPKRHRNLTAILLSVSTAKRHYNLTLL